MLDRFGSGWPDSDHVYEITRCSEGVLKWDNEIHDHGGLCPLLEGLMHFFPRSDQMNRAPHFFGHCQPIQYDLSERPPMLLALESDDMFTWGDGGNAQIFYEIQPDGSVKFSFEASCG
jgi:hypothetical protein